MISEIAQDSILQFFTFPTWINGRHQDAGGHGDADEGAPIDSLSLRTFWSVKSRHIATTFGRRLTVMMIMIRAHCKGASIKYVRVCTIFGIPPPSSAFPVLFVRKIGRFLDPLPPSVRTYLMEAPLSTHTHRAPSLARRSRQRNLQTLAARRTNNTEPSTIFRSEAFSSWSRVVS